MKPNLLILGGDQRNRIVLDILRERGFSVEYFSDTRRENTQAAVSYTHLDVYKRQYSLYLFIPGTYAKKE